MTPKTQPGGLGRWPGALAVLALGLALAGLVGRERLTGIVPAVCALLFLLAALRKKTSGSVLLITVAAIAAIAAIIAIISS